MARAERPAAIVLGGDSPIGLTVVRELGEHGVPVHVIARSREGVALYSRWATTRHLRSPDRAGTLALVNQIAADEGAEFLLAISESDNVLVREAADAGQLGRLRSLVPPLAALRRVNDKIETIEAARAVGIPAPATWQPADGYDPGPFPTALTFPCILKWRDPMAVAEALAQAGLALNKAEFCSDASALRRALARYAPAGRYPMVQEFAPGVGLGHMLFMWNGRALLRFQHIRQAEWPPEGGFSTVCESLPHAFHAEWLDRSEKLLEHIGWQGAAMVEYRYDARTDHLALMEINGRFWGSLPLAYHSGAQFAWLTYAVLGLGRAVELPAYRSGIVCRYMIPETRRVLTLLFRSGTLKNTTLERRRGHAVARYLIDFLQPSTRYFVFSCRDPRPFFADMQFMVAKALRRLAATLSRR
jgi:predicted ATP-grasp superfamily ATP-dependent carboligase